MKLNYLMINDWVSVEDVTGPVRVKEILTNSIIVETGDGRILKKEHFWPLLLTESMLKGNGWTVSSNFCNGAMTHDAILYSCIYKVGNKGWGFSGRAITIYNDVFRPGTNIPVMFVHEYQQALRSIGYYELADKFDPNETA